MSTPSSTPFSSKLKEFLEPFFPLRDDPEVQPGAQFAHIQVPPYRLGSVSLLESVRQTFVAGGVTDLQIFVVPEQEKQIGTGVNEDGGRTSALTFSELNRHLRDNKTAAGEWREGFSWPDDWVVGRILPPEAIFILQLDPQVSADCALSLVGLVQWAFDMSADEFTNIRVLTLSAEKDCNFLSEVVSFTAPGYDVAHLDLAAFGQHDPFQNCDAYHSNDTTRVVEQILRCLREGPTSRRLIMSFDPKLEKALMSQLTGDERKSFETIVVNVSRSLKALQNLQQSSFKTQMLTFIGAPSFLPTQFEGYHEIHLVLDSRTRSVLSWDNLTLQVIEYPRHVPREDCQMQAWWILQPKIPRKFVYVPAATAPQFLERGPLRPRLVENTQLGGFVAAAIDSWGMSADRIMSCFVRYPLQVQEMIGRLKVQRLITPVGLALSTSEAKVFRSCLSPLGYDHRLAMFVALDSQQPIARVKIQLAVLLKHGLPEPFRVVSPESFRNPQYIKTLIGKCHGIGSSLAKQGTLWLYLGLFKHAVMVSSDGDGTHSGLEGVEYLPSHARLALESDMAQVASLVGGLFSDEVRDALEAPISAESADNLGSDATGELQRQLLRAFVYQLTVSYYPKINGRRDKNSGLLHKVLSTLSPCGMDIVSSQRPTAVIHVQSHIDREGGDFVFGFCHSFYRADKRPLHLGKDWTLIPGEMVARWLSEFRPDMNMHALLNQGIQHYTEN
ncbi:hypothetical protein FNAPI_9695 [Fusarium napiforme]|uniref:Uncharacterized protein n=1 Tax=Fusarium napiforme TaxID=42672 RepID=A0A8H5IU63_9HYPO|nr:hypothetical protein FNAPI_9695 [Fusarium napiforme]